MNWRIAPEDVGTPDAAQLLDALSQTLAAITGDSGRSSFSVDDMQEAGACFVIARDSCENAVGCGAIRPLQHDTCELKRMYAMPGHPGLGSAILAFLEAQAAASGYQALWLETRRVNLNAVGFYRKRGYTEIDNYGRYRSRPEAVCLGKVLFCVSPGD